MRHSEENLQKILETLLKNDSDGFVTLDDLSQVLNISKRSVQNYLNKADSWLLEHDLPDVRIIKKQGYGIRLSVDFSERQKLASLIKSRYFTMLEGSVERRIEILRSLVFSKEELTIQFLADQFYVSRFVILSELDWVENWLSQYKLKLFKTQRRGIGIAGDEISRRAAIAGFFDLKELKNKSVVYESKQISRLSKENLQKLEEVYDKKDIINICAIIEDAEKEFDFFMGSDFFTALVTHMTISVFRLRHGCEVKKEFLPPNEEFPQLEMNTALFIAKRLESMFSIKLPESECIYICIHLMSYNTFLDQPDGEYRMPENIEMLAMHLTEAIDAELGSNFAGDKMLFFGLVYHLRSAIYRLKENLGSHEHSFPILPDNYEDIYSSICKNTNLYQQFGQVAPDQKELISIAFHFGLSMERITQKKRALIVSNSGILTQMEMYHDIQQNLPEIKVVDICSSQQLSFCEESRYDFIIATASLENTSKPVANIAHMDKEESRRFIEEFVFTKLCDNT